MANSDGTLVPVIVQAGEIAAMLGGDWRAEPSAHDHMRAVLAVLCGPDGERLEVRTIDRKPRLVISGSLSAELRSHVPYGATLGKITVARNRRAGEIAGEIARRLLPAYRDLLVVVNERKATEDEHNREVSALLAEMAGIYGLENVPAKNSAVGVFINGPGITGSVYVETGDRLRFDIRANAAVGRRLAAAIKSLL